MTFVVVVVVVVEVIVIIVAERNGYLFQKNCGEIKSTTGKE